MLSQPETASAQKLIRQVKKRFTAEALPKGGRIVTTDELGDAVANEI